MLAQARRALTESDRAIRLARLAAHGDWGELSLLVLPAVALALLPAIVRAYRDAHPAIGVTVSESFDDEQLTALTAGRIDAGFLRAAAAPPGIRLQTLLTEPVLAGLPADHRLARQDRIALSELAEESFVFFPRHRSVLAYDELLASCRVAGFSPAIVQEASGISALGFVAAGLGVTVVAASYQALSPGRRPVRPRRGAPAHTPDRLGRRQHQHRPTSIPGNRPADSKPDRPHPCRRPAGSRALPPPPPTARRCGCRVGRFGGGFRGGGGPHGHGGVPRQSGRGDQQG